MEAGGSSSTCADRQREPSEEVRKMVKVLIWNFLRHGNLGHAALEVRGEYISWWPSERAKVMLGRQPGVAGDEDSDAASEGRGPDHRIWLHGLDEDAMCRWWRGFRDGEEYRLVIQNCSTVVAMALKCGGAMSRASVSGFDFVVWTPSDVRRFAEAIERG
jgi:hypothetical protein